MKPQIESVVIEHRVVMQHNVKYTTVPTRDGKEYMRPNGQWDGAISKAKRFSSKEAADEYASDRGMSYNSYVLVEVE